MAFPIEITKLSEAILAIEEETLQEHFKKKTPGGKSLFLFDHINAFHEKPVMDFFAISKCKYHLNLVTCRKRGSDRPRWSFADLPRSINSSSLSELCSRFTKRLRDLPESERVKANSERVIGNKTIPELLKTLQDKSEIVRFLSMKGTPSEVVPTELFQLYTILHAIQEQSNVVPPGKILSPQEDMLLGFAASVVACEIGQRDGISGFYNYGLPSQYWRFKENRVNEAEEEKIIGNRLDLIVQKLLSDLLVDKNIINKCLEAIGCEKKVTGQEVHFGLFMKNRLFKQLGLIHEISDDPYASQVFSELRQTARPGTDPTWMLDAILSNISLDMWVGEIQRKFDLKQKGFTAYMTTLLTETMKIDGHKEDWFKANPDWIEQYLDIDNLSLTKDGAVFLLKKFQYFE